MFIIFFTNIPNNFLFEDCFFSFPLYFKFDSIFITFYIFLQLAKSYKLRLQKLVSFTNDLVKIRWVNCFVCIILPVNKVESSLHDEFSVEDLWKFCSDINLKKFSFKFWLLKRVKKYNQGSNSYSQRKCLSHF
jgi:hypothetical protein